MKDQKVSKLVRAALLAALCFVLTKAVTVPAPTGYVNLGDCAVLLSAWMLGPIYGGLSAGVGVMLADMLSPYAFYAPGTFLVKFAMAAAAALIFQAMKGRGTLAARIVGGIAAEIIMVAGYFIYESLVLGVGAAAVASVPANVVQGLFGLVAGVLLAAALEKGKLIVE